MNEPRTHDQGDRTLILFLAFVAVFEFVGFTAAITYWLLQ